MNTSQRFNWHWKFLILGPIAFILSLIASQFPSIVEKFYSNGLQKLIRQGLSLITRIVPFSLTELSVILFSLLCLVSLLIMILRVIRKKWTLILFLKHISRNVLLFISLVYFITTITIGLGYNREPFLKSADLELQEYGLEDLVITAKSLIGKVNELRENVSEDDDGYFQLPEDKLGNIKVARTGIKDLSGSYPQLTGVYGLPKRTLITGLFKKLNVWGLYSFLGETLISDAVPDLYVPYVASHEIAHQRGIINEGDANYVGYLASINNSDPNFQYAGYFIALEYVMNEIFKLHKGEHTYLYTKIDYCVKKDWKYARSQLSQWNTLKFSVLGRINDVYMKSHGVSEGIDSYNRFVDLLVAEFTDN